MVDWSGLGARPPWPRWGIRLLLPLVVGLAGGCLSDGAEAAVGGRADGQAQLASALLGAAGPRAGSEHLGRATLAREQGQSGSVAAGQRPAQGPVALGLWWWVAGLLAAGVPVAAAIRAWRRPLYRVERSLQIAAEPAWLAGRLGDLRHWAAWSTLAAFGPRAERRFEGADPRPGSAMSWAEARPPRQGRIEVDLSGLPDELSVVCTRARSPSVRDLLTFRLVPAEAGHGTVLRCVSHGQAPWLARVLDPVLPVEARKARQLQAELAALKRAAEAAMIAP